MGWLANTAPFGFHAFAQASSGWFRKRRLLASAGYRLALAGDPRLRPGSREFLRRLMEAVKGSMPPLWLSLMASPAPCYAV